MNTSQVPYSPLYQVVVESPNTAQNQDLYLPPSEEQIADYHQTWNDSKKFVEYFLIMIAVMIVIGLWVIIVLS